MNFKVSRRTTMKGMAAAAAATALTPIGRASAAQTSFTARVDRYVEAIDPAFRSGPADGNVIRSVHQRLVSLRPDNLQTEMDAAQEIKQVSDKLIEFTLKPNQMFTDGYGEMTADDVKFSFERFAINLQGGKESPYKGDWSALEQVEVTGKHTGRIHLKKASASIWRTAIGDNSGCILSRKAIEKLGEAAKIQPVGSGAFRVAKFVPQQEVVLQANPDYKGAKPHFREFTVRYVKDPKTAELAFRSNELDFSEMPLSNADALRGVSGTKIVEMPGLRYLWIGLNVEKAPLDNIKVRQAVQAAIDVDQMLIAGFNGKVKRAYAMIQPELVGYWADVPKRKRDVALAKKLLAEAGHPNGIKIKLSFENVPLWQTMALVAQATLAEAGIQVELQPLEGGAFWSLGKGDGRKNIDMSMQRFNAKMDPSFTAQWFVSGQIGQWNWQSWSNPEFDKLHEAAQMNMDEKARAQQVIQMQKLMDESAAYIWLTHDISVFAARSWLKPLVMPNGSDWEYRGFAEV